ncbi:MAG TPA: T9SS type A sorting domain-containing protein, partial [Flavobacterium sp.]|nr:T9SS type A sorting domain-containing protein [Flavobacterium sp.]
SPYGNTCTVTAPAASRNITKEPLTNFNVKAWPNPFSGAATLGFFDAGTSPVSVKVFDMTGKLLDAFEVATGTDTLTLGDRYPAGVYTVSATCQSVSRTLRIVKR